MQDTLIAPLFPLVDYVTRKYVYWSADREDVRQRVLMHLAQSAAIIEPLSPAQRRMFIYKMVRCTGTNMRVAMRDFEDVDCDEIVAVATIRTPESLLDQRRLARGIMDYLRDLTTSARELMDLVAVQEYSVVEAASALGIPVGTAKTRLRRVRRAIGRFFGTKK